MAEKDFRVPVFRKAIRGYSPEHVDAFITVVQEKYYTLIAENEKLRARLSAITAENKKRGIEEEMRRREIEEIREEAESLLREAKGRADRLLREAEAEAKRVRDDANAESARTREDAETYAEEAKREALEMLKERDGMLSRATLAVSGLREKLGEEYERALRALDGLEDDAAGEREDAAAENVPSVQECPDVPGPEPEQTGVTDDGAEEVPVEISIPGEISDVGENSAEETGELTISGFVSDREEDETEKTDEEPTAEPEEAEEPEEPEEGKNGFPFAFDEEDYYREDAGEEYGEDEEYEEDAENGEYEEDAEDEEFSEAIPDFISEYPDGETEGGPEDGFDDVPDDYATEVEDGTSGYPEDEGTEEEPAEEEPGPEKEETEEDEESDAPFEEEAGDDAPTDGDFTDGTPGEYRDYDLDEILKGLEYMTSGKTEETVASSDVLTDDADIVDALKKKFGDVPDGDHAAGGEEDGSDNKDFYDDEVHEDGESFDPNNFLRFRK